MIHSDDARIRAAIQAVEGDPDRPVIDVRQVVSAEPVGGGAPATPTLISQFAAEHDAEERAKFIESIMRNDAMQHETRESFW